VADGQTEALNSALSDMGILGKAKAAISASVRAAIEQVPVQ
jgi:hypothetical protein